MRFAKPKMPREQQVLFPPEVWPFPDQRSVFVFARVPFFR
jgi:hypothetical protein